MTWNRLWPPSNSYKLSILWSLILGFVLQIAVPLAFIVLGFKEAVWIPVYPGLLPIIWITGGWFAGISPLGYVLMFSVNTVVYAIILFAGIRACVCLHRRYA